MGPDKPCQLIRLTFFQRLGTLLLVARVPCFLSSLLTATFRSRLSLLLEVVALRHQLAMYRLKGQRSRIGPADRLLWSMIAGRDNINPLLLSRNRFLAVVDATGRSSI